MDACVHMDFATSGGVRKCLGHRSVTPESWRPEARAAPERRIGRLGMVLRANPVRAPSAPRSLRGTRTDGPPDQSLRRPSTKSVMSVMWEEGDRRRRKFAGERSGAVRELPEPTTPTTTSAETLVGRLGMVLRANPVRAPAAPRSLRGTRTDGPPDHSLRRPPRSSCLRTRSNPRSSCPASPLPRFPASPLPRFCPLLDLSTGRDYVFGLIKSHYRIEL